MFESIRPPRRSRPRIVVLLSIAAHAAAIAFLALTGLWRVDKLGVDDVPLAVASRPGGLLGAAVDQPEPEQPTKPQRARPRADLPRGERAEAEADDDKASGAGETGTGVGTEGEGEVGLGLFPCGEGGSCTTILDQAGKAPPPPPRKVEAEKVVVAHLIEGARIEGNPRIEPPDSVRQAMVRVAEDKVKGDVKMCLDRDGRVRSLRMLRSTGHAEYDQRLLAGMRTWRYRPYRLDSGAAVSVCTVVTFIYRVQ